MDIRKRVFIGLGVCAGLAVMLMLAYRVFAPTETPADDKTATVSSETGNTNQVISGEGANISTVPDRPILASGDAYIQQLARMVVEWAGSYSNQNNNAHLEAVRPLVTDSMYSYLSEQAPDASREYAGVTTQVIVNNLVKKTASSATVEIGVQEFSADQISSATVHKNGTVQLVKQNDTWRVSGIYWDKE